MYKTILLPPPSDCDSDDSPTQQVNWSNVTIWPNETLPSAGQDVLIKASWILTMDVQPAKINNLMVYGKLIIPDTRDLTIEANNIWVKGELSAGSEEEPFEH